MNILSVILLLLLLAAVAVAVLFYVRKREADARTLSLAQNIESQLRQQQENHQNELARLTAAHQTETATLRQAHQAETDTLRQVHQAETENLRQSHQTETANLQQAHRAEMANLQEQFRHAQAEQQRQWEERLATLRLEFDKLSHQHLEQQRQSLSAANRESLDALLTPFRENIDNFRRQFGSKMDERLQAETLIKQMVAELGQRAQRLDETTAGLTRALRGDAKKQGDWGEAVLNNILEASGLERGRDFFVQESSTGDDGRRFIPDVKVKLHGESYLIIDSKTSIANYLDYVSAADDDVAARQQALRAHLASVRQHVAELADKHYPARVKQAAEYVLMFIPNEGSYLLAVDNDPRLLSDAFNRGIIVVNPTLLMLAMRIVWLFWQNEKQAKSVNAIIEQSRKLYEKFATFSQTYADLGQRIVSLQGIYQKGDSQLTQGPGNIVRQMENLRKRGVISEKRIDPKLLDHADEEEESPAGELPSEQATEVAEGDMEEGEKD